MGRISEAWPALALPAKVLVAFSSVMPGLVPRLSGTVCAFMPPSPFRGKHDLFACIAPLGLGMP